MLRRLAPLGLGLGVLAGASGARGDEPNAAPTPETYEVRLQDLEKRVEELKRRVRMVGRVDPATTRFVVRSRTSSTFVPVSARVMVDGRVSGQAELGPQGAQIEVPNDGRTHVVGVAVRLRAHDGFFSYVDSYRFDVSAVARLPLDATREVEVIVREDQDVTLPLERRLEVVFP